MLVRKAARLVEFRVAYLQCGVGVRGFACQMGRDNGSHSQGQHHATDCSGQAAVARDPLARFGPAARFIGAHHTTFQPRAQVVAEFVHVAVTGRWVALHGLVGDGDQLGGRMRRELVQGLRWPGAHGIQDLAQRHARTGLQVGDAPRE